jgi:iron complex outermembrane recepter protein
MLATNRIGEHPVGIPRSQASLWTTGRFENGPAAVFTIGGGVRFVGDQAVDALNALAVPSSPYDMMVHTNSA